VQQHDGPYAANNKTHFSNPRFSELITAAMAQPDVNERRKLIHEAQAIQHDIGGMLIWGYSNVLDAATKRIGGIEQDRTGFASWRTDKLWVKSA
jgi:peptide/nickel transport system substrate-binding protein